LYILGEHHQDEFKQAYSADEGQVQDPLPQVSRFIKNLFTVPLRSQVMTHETL
jgi:hypothetical protein